MLSFKWLSKSQKEEERKVLHMAQIEYIKYLYENEGLSLREIARRTNKDFRTVQKYAYRNDWNPPAVLKMDPGDYPVLGEFIPKIDKWLEQDEREPRKQRHTISRIFNRLQKEHGYSGCYASVKRYANRKKDMMKKAREGFLPLEHPAGHAETDFGKFKYYDPAEMAKEGYALILSFPHSNAGFMQVFPSENQECLLTGLQRIFHHIGGVPLRLRCDNMTTAVAQILKNKERVITDGFHRFMLHYRFGVDFCNPAKGNEKGNAENKVGYTRRNMLVPIPVIDDFDAYNEMLLKMCDEDHNRKHYKHDAFISGLWGEDKQSLLELPEYGYSIFRYEGFNVNKYGFVSIDKVKYGLSPELCGKTIQAKIYFDKIEAYFDHNLLKTFKRCYEKNTEVYDWREYISVLAKKPGAIPHTRFFNQMPKLWQRYLESAGSKERKTALAVLTEIVSDGNGALCDEALELALENGRTDADSVRQCYYMIARPVNDPEPLNLASNPPILNYCPDLSSYDLLTGGAAK